MPGSTPPVDGATSTCALCEGQRGSSTKRSSPTSPRGTSAQAVQKTCTREGRTALFKSPQLCVRVRLPLIILDAVAVCCLVFTFKCTRAQVSSRWRRSSGFTQGLPRAWQKTYEAKNPAEMREAYSEWAPTYDEDSIDTFGYRAPDAASEVLAEYMRRYSFDGQSRVLDGICF